MKAKNYHLIHAVNATPMFMRQESAWAYMPKVISLLTASVDDDDEESEASQKAANERFLQQYAATFSAEVKPYLGDNWYYRNPPFVVNGILIIPIMDAIMQYDYCGVAGTTTIMSWYEAARNDKSIKGVIELANSGGGAVFGTKELAEYKLEYPKPKLTVVQGMACSAMFFIACGSDEIWATSEMCIVGSVGVMTRFTSFKAYYAKQNINIFDLYSKASPLKNNASRMAENGDMSGYTDGILFELDTVFMDFVKDTRMGVTKKVLDGADMIASEGLKNGLVDNIGSLTEAIDYITNTSQKDMKKNAKLSNLINAMTALFKAEGVDLKVEVEGDESSNNADATPPAAKAEPTTPEAATPVVTPKPAAENNADELAAKDAEIAELKAQLAARKGTAVAKVIKQPEALIDPTPKTAESNEELSFYAIPPQK